VPSKNREKGAKLRRGNGRLKSNRAYSMSFPLPRQKLPSFYNIPQLALSKSKINPRGEKENRKGNWTQVKELRTPSQNGQHFFALGRDSEPKSKHRLLK